MNLSDRIALFNEGHIEQLGTPVELYQQPETLFTARFFGDSNVFPLVGTLPDALSGPPSGAAPGTVTWAECAWQVDSHTVSERARASGRVALVVRPEDVHIAGVDEVVPPDANAVSATVREIEYMGAYRTAVLAFGRSQVTGRARLDARASELSAGQSVVAWWRIDRQRLVAD